jgi:hypothetical protein
MKVKVILKELNEALISVRLKHCGCSEEAKAEMKLYLDSWVVEPIERAIHLIEKDPRCVLCNKKLLGFGNNPAPLSDSGLCCDSCNGLKVIPARLKGLM